MIKINQQLISGQNRPGIKLRQLRAIIIHWTANASKGATAMANRNYFNTTTTHASAHYIVDKNEIVQCIPDNEIAYHVGANQYKPEAMKLFDNNNPNNYTIGIEICNNDDWEAAVGRAVKLTAYLLEKYNFTVDNLMRHFDVTGKNCPAPMVSDSSQWELFKQAVQVELDNCVLSNEIKDEDPLGIVGVRGTSVVTASVLNVRSSPSVTSNNKIGSLKNGSEVELLGFINNGWIKIKFNDQIGYISGEYTENKCVHYV